MQIPLDFYNVSLWFAVTDLILFITAQLVSAYDGNATMFIDQRKLKNTAIVIGALFLVTVVIRIYGIASSK